MEYLSKSYKEYEKIKLFVEEYKNSKSLSSDNDLPKTILEQYKLCLEMYDLLPVKMSKLSQ